MKKLFTAVAALAVLSGAVYAQQAKAPAKDAKAVTYEAVIIADTSHPAGGEDKMLNSAIEQTLGGVLKTEVITVADAKNRPEFKEIDTSFLPVYLIKRNKQFNELFTQHIEAGVLPLYGDYAAFYRQTRNGVLDRPAQPKTLELFVMSQCPYGVMAVEKITAAHKEGKLPKDIKITLRYFGGEQGGEFRSSHGSAEWEENIRQLLVQKYYPSKLWNYLAIRNKDYMSSLWDDALEQAGISVKDIKKKFNKEGKELFREDIKYVREVGADASPAFLWEGRVLLDIMSVSQIPGLEFFNPMAGASSPQAAAALAEGSC